MTQGINAWLDDDLNVYGDNVNVPIEYFEEALKIATDSEKQKVCDEISEHYKNLELVIIRKAISHALVGDSIKFYYFGLRPTLKRYERMEKLGEVAKEKGVSFQLIELSSLVKLMINFCFSEFVSFLPLKNDDLFSEGNCLIFDNVEEIDRYRKLLYAMCGITPPINGEELKIFASYDNYEIIFKRYVSLARLLIQLLDNTCSYLADKYYLGTYTDSLEEMLSAIERVKSRASDFGRVHLSYKNLTPNFERLMKSGYNKAEKEVDELKEQMDLLNEELQKIHQKYQPQIDSLCKKKKSISGIFMSKENKQNLINNINELEIEKTKYTKALNKKISDAENKYEKVSEITDMLYQAKFSPFYDELDWENMCKYIKNQGKDCHIPNKIFNSKEDLIEYL